MHTFIELLFLLTFVSLGATECQVVLNEVNVETPKKPEDGEFIELKVKTFTFFKTRIMQLT